MRYISKNQDFPLLFDTGNVTPPVNDPQPKAAYKFFRGELIVGDPTTDGTNNEIDFDALMDIIPTASGNDAKGLNSYFWEAPYLDENATLEVGKYYKVILAPVTYDSVELEEHDVFLCVSGTTSFTGSGTVALELDPVYWTTTELNQRANAYKLANLSSAQDEASWNDKTWQQDLPSDPYSWTR